MTNIDLISDYIGVPLTPCKSSNLVAYGHKSDELWILFKNNKLYKYLGVTKSQFLELEAASSKGSWVNKNLIKKEVKYEAFKVV